jgi:hypothetical protein
MRTKKDVTMLRSLTSILLAAALALVLAACGARQPIEGRSPDDLDRKLSTFAFIEQGDLVTFIVDTQAARYRDKSAFMPLEIAIANNGVKNLVIARESFELIDENGTRYPAASPRELYEGYDFLDVDRDQLAELESIVFGKFAAYTRYESKFSPTHMSARDNSLLSATTVRDMVSLPRFGYLLDFIYFPKPETGIKGHRFELFLDAQGVDNPIFLKFEVK